MTLHRLLRSTLFLIFDLIVRLLRISIEFLDKRLEAFALNAVDPQKKSRMNASSQLLASSSAGVDVVNKESFFHCPKIKLPGL
jgi:hypothetical protein